MNQNVCPQCGAPLSAGAKECKYCGEVIVVPIAQVNIPEPQQVIYQEPEVQGQNSAISQSWPIRSKTVAGLLGLFLGGLGIHKFYLGKIFQGVVYLLLSWTYITMVVGFIEGIIYLSSSDESFQLKNKVRLK